MKKQLNVDLIRNELRGGSAFFPGYTGGQSPPSLGNPPALQEPSKVVHKPKPITHEHNATELPGGKPQKPLVQSPIIQGVPPTVPRPVPRTDPRTDHLVPKTKRPMRQRQPFDVYEDQYQRLKQIAASERDFVNGRGMSQMVREAIDAYLAASLSPDKK